MSENEKLAETLQAYMNDRCDKICERCGKKYDQHGIIMVVDAPPVGEELPRCAAFTFDTGSGRVAFAPCDKAEVLH